MVSLLIIVSFLLTSSAASDDAVLQTGFVAHDGESIYYETAGTGDAVVLCHGLGGNHAIWYQQTPVLARDHRVVTWDQRGFGRSTNRQERSGPAAAVTDLKAVLDALGIERAHIIGQSMGGWAALGFAAQYPDRVERLVLADTIGGIYTEAIRAHFDAYIRVAAAGPPPNEMPIHRHPALGEQLGARNPAKAFLYRQIGGLGPGAPADMGLKLRTTEYGQELLLSVNMPVLFVAGENDPIFPPEVIREAARQLRDSRVAIVPGTGHSPYFEDPDSWNELILNFLGEASKNERDDKGG